MASPMFRSVRSGFLANKRIVLVLTLLGILGGLTIIPYQLALLGQSLSSAVPQGQPSLAVLIILTVVQTAVITFLASTIGLSLAPKTGLGAPLLRSWLYRGERPAFSKKWLFVAVSGSFLGSFLLMMADMLLFQPHLPKLSPQPAVSMWKNALTFVYGGIVEEVLVRLFLMTAFVWIIAKCLGAPSRIPSPVYWISIVLATILFGAGHLPATAALFGDLTPLIIARALFGNGLLGILFGYLYWKKGLEYAIISHMFGDLFLHVLWPLILTYE